jgi:hypothetical protein
MGRACSICTRPDRKAIDKDLVGGVSLGAIVKAHRGLATSSLSRHRQRHVSPALAALVRAQAEDDHSKSLLELLSGHLATVDRLLRTAEAQGSLQTALQAVREARGLIELTARMTGELDERPQTLVVNLASSQEWIETRSVILAALARHPAARADVVAALAGGAAPDASPQAIEGRVVPS